MKIKVFERGGECRRSGCAGSKARKTWGKAKNKAEINNKNKDEKTMSRYMYEG